MSVACINSSLAGSVLQKRTGTRRPARKWATAVSQSTPPGSRLLPQNDVPPSWLLCLLTVGVAVLLAGTPLPITDGDSAFYATISKYMLASGDWLTLRHPAFSLMDKPPLTFWLMDISFMAFGTSEWVLRAWHLIFALGILLTTYALARMAVSRAVALLSSLILLTSIQFFYQSLTPEQDIPLTLFISLTLYGYLRWEGGGPRWTVFLACAAAALGMLTKGIIGVALPVMIIGIHWIIDRPPLPRGGIGTAAAGLVVFLAIAVPWYAFGALRQGRPFIDTFFFGGRLGAGRFVHAVLHSPTAVPWWAGFGAYVPLLFLGALPWSGWIWPALFGDRRGLRPSGSVLRVCALWVAIVFLFQSLSLGDKTIRYILPLFPPLAVLLAGAVNEGRWAKQAAYVCLAVALPLMVAVIAVFYWKLPADAARYRPLALIFLPAFAGAIGGYAVLALSGRPKAGVIFLVLTTCLAYALAMTGVARNWDQISPWRPVGRVIERLPQTGAPVLILGTYNEFADYYITRPVKFVQWGDLVQTWRREPVIAVVPQAELGRFPPLPQPVIVGRAPGGLMVISNARLD
jgi:4-amino-4-deoxy-L-arabinose transferase-like glycosyltransferase